MRALSREAVFALAGVLASGNAFADGFENIPTGSRTAAMGGAGIAGGYDSAMPTLNPAGLALIPGSIASVSASLYQYAIVSVPNFVADGDTIPTDFGDVTVSQRGVESKEFASFPSAAAYFLHLGSQESPTILGISLSIPKSIGRRFLQNTEYLGEGLSFKENVTYVDTEQTYVGAISWASRFGALRTGVSVVGGYTELVRTINLSQLQVQGTAGFHRVDSRETNALNSLDFGLLAGAQFDLTNSIRVGATFRPPSLHAMGSVDGAVDTVDLGSDGEPRLSTTLRSGDAVRGIPMRVGAGIEYHTEEWGVALDANLFIPREREYRTNIRMVRSEIGGDISTEDTGRGPFEIVVPTKKVLNVGLGAEAKVTDSNWLRAGFFTEFSTFRTSENELEALMTRGQNSGPPQLFQFPIARFGGSAGWGSRFGPIDTTFGIRVSYGAGTTLRIDPEKRFRFSSRPAGPIEEATDAKVFEGLAFLSAAVDLSKNAAGMIGHMRTGGLE